MSWWKNDPLAEEATTSKWWESDPIADVVLPEEEAAPSFADEVFAVPEPSRDVAPDETDSRRASRGLGRSAYLDDGSLPDLDINNPTPRRVPAAEGVRTAGLDPFTGEGMGALAKRRGQQFARGATEVAASLPEASAISSAQVEATQVEEAKKLLARRAEQITDLEARLQRDLPDQERRFVEQQISDLQAGQEELRRRASAEVKPAGERERFARGDAIRQRSEDIFGAPDPRDTSFWAAVAEGAGNMTALAATSMVPGGVVAGATLGAGLNKAQVYKEAIAAGADEETAQKAANWGAVIGATEIVPISRALKALPPRLRPKITNRVLRKFADLAQGAGEEAAQEYLATVANNIVAQQIYDPERGWTEGATENALVGAILGGPLGVMGGAGTARYREDDDPDRPNSPRLTPEDRQSPIPNDVIDDGKKIMEEAVSPRKPSDGIPPLPQGGADVRTPDTDFRRPNPVPPLRTEQPAAAPQPPQEPQPANPQGVTPENTETASERRLSEPFPEVDGDVDTGRIVQLDLDTGEVIEAGSQNAQASVETDVETPQVERPSPLDTVATEGLPTAPQVAAPSQPRKKPAKPTVMKRPLANTMKQYGVKPGSPLAKELAARDINARTHPGLFRSDGRTDWDNIAADTFGEMAAEIGEDGQGYLSQEGLIEALERETVGVLLPVGEQAELRAARDAKEAEARFEEATPDPDPIDLSAFAGANAYIPPRNDDISTDAERIDMVERSLRGVLTETSLDGVLTDTEVNTIRNRLTENGGNVEDAVWSQIYRSADSADPITEGTGARDAEGGSPAVAGADGKGSGEPAVQPRAEAGSAARVDDGKRGDVGQEGVDDLAGKPSVQVARGKLVGQPDAANARVEDGQGSLAAAAQSVPAAAGAAEGAQPGSADQNSSEAALSEVAARSLPSIKDAKPLPFGPTSIRPRPIAEGKRLYRETNPEALDDILRVEGQPDSMRAFVTDNRDLAIGQGGNKGVMLTFRPDSLSGEVNPKPGTTPETGMEYRTDMRVGQALERVEMPQATAKKLRGLSKRILARDFVRTDVGDQAVFTRKGDPLPAEATTERTEAGEQTVIPGAEQSEERSAEARKSGEKWEMEVRAKQSKMRTSTPQQEAGGLFDTQGDLLDGADTARQSSVSSGADNAEISSGDVPEGGSASKPKSRAQTRLEDRLKREWTARENLPDSDEDGFMEATKRVQEARQALEAEAGPEAAKAALERIEAEYTPDVQEAVQDAPKREAEETTDRDFGTREDAVEAEDTPRRQEQVATTSPAAQEVAAIEAALPDLRKRLDQMALKRVKLEAADGETFQGAFEARGQDIRILIGATADPAKTVNHEAIHALRNMDLFTEKEWDALSAEAEKTWLDKYDIADRYGDLEREGQIEEAIAEAYGDFVSERTEPGPIKNAFAKLRRALRAVSEWVTGNPSVQSVFEAVDTGAIGARDSETANVAMLYQRPPLSAQGRAQTAQQTNTAHIPSPGVYNASQQRTGALMRALSNAKGNVDDKIDRFRVLFQDQMIYLRRAEEMIAAHTGQEIDKADSAYYAEERYSGRVGYQLNDLKDRYVEPIAQMVWRNLDKLTLEDHKGQKREGAEAVSLYLWARHAKERNKRINDIQGGPSGSGLTDAEADAIMARAKASPGYGLMQKIGKLADQLGTEMIDKRVDAGLLTKAEAATWKAQYKHYVPLKGFAETDMFDAVGTTPMAPRGRKFNVRGKESKMALGRDTESFDQLSNLIAQAEEVIVRAEKNIVGRTLYDLIQTNPAPGIWEVKDLETRRVYNKASGRVETQILNAAQVQMGPDEMAVKVDGEEKRIKFNDPRLARALGQLGVDGLGPVARVASYFSRYFSAVNTMLSPPFVIVNGFRDMVTAQFNLGQLPPGVRGKLRRKANPLSPAYWKSMAGAYSGLGKNPSQSEYAKWFREFEEAGAKVSFWNIENPQARKDTLERMMKNETGGKLRRGLRKGTRLNTDDNPALGWIERVNLMVDNATRLAVYAEARKNGMTKEEAASLSKNLTVNFNRRGELGASLNAWYPFANAAIQGSHVLLKAAKAKNVRQLIGGAFVLGFVNELQNAMRSGDEDDDGELDHDEIPNYVSERNFIIKLGGNERLTIPLPYGFNVPFYAGQQMAKVVRGVKPANEATAHTFAATFTSFSPISGEDVASTLSPTLLDHVRELDKNENWQGRPIRPEQAHGDYGPQSYKEWNTYPLFGSLARGLNSATGGSPIEPGGIDISPEYMQHTFEFLGGGLWRFLNRSYETGRNVATGQEVEPHRIPLLRVLRYEPSDWLNQGRYFDFREEVMAAREAVKTAQEISYPVKPEMLSASRLYGQLKSAEKARKAISSQMNAIYANDALTEREKREKVKPLQDQRNAIYVKFNREFVRTMGPQAE